jgi:hypothetical protein
MRTRLLAPALLATLSLLASATGAASPRDVFEKRGLFGTRAVDCTKPMGASNPYVVYRPLAGEGVRREVLVEPGRVVNTSIAQSAVESAADELIVASQTGEGDVVNRIRLHTDEAQVIDSTRPNGEKLIVGGRNVRDNTESLRFHRCSGATV